jgi:hypothetical protein
VAGSCEHGNESSKFRESKKSKVSKAIPVPGRGGPQGCERLRLPHYLDKRPIDGGKVVSPTRLPHFTPRFLHFFLKIPGTHFC